MSLPALLNLAGPVNWLDPLSRGLRAWWLCVPGLMSGSRWVDLCATSNNQTLHGTLTGGAAFGDSLNRGGGWGRVLFDGTDDTVSIANLPLMGNDATLCCWVNGTSFAANKTLFCAQNGASDNSLTMECGRTANRLSVLHSGSAVHTGANNVPGTNVWFHAAFTRTGTSGAWTVTTYINGALDSSTGSIATNPYPLATPNVRIGTNPGIAGRYLSGAMDDVRIYSRALSAGEIRQVYLSSRTGHPGLLNRLAVGRLAEASGGGTEYDESGRAVSLLAATGQTNAQAMLNSGNALTTLLALTGETDTRAMQETALVAALLLAQSGNTAAQAMLESGKAVPLLALLGESDQRAGQETGLATLLQALTGQSAQAAVSEAGRGLSLTVLTGATHVAAMLQSGLPVSILALTGLTDTFSGDAAFVLLTPGRGAQTISEARIAEVLESARIDETLRGGRLPN